jgi:hypothetical protein
MQSHVQISPTPRMFVFFIVVNDPASHYILPNIRILPRPVSIEKKQCLVGKSQSLEKMLEI